MTTPIEPGDIVRLRKTQNGIQAGARCRVEKVKGAWLQVSDLENPEKKTFCRRAELDIGLLTELPFQPNRKGI